MHTPPLTEGQIRGLIARQVGPIDRRMLEQMWRELLALRDNEAVVRQLHHLEHAY